MGCCNITTNGKVNTITRDQTNGFLTREYRRSAVLSVKQKNAKGQLLGMNTLKFNYKEPMLVSSRKLGIGQNSYWASACVIPGLDPHGEINKKCQDFCICLNDENSFIIALFDGHGAEGERVVDLCSQTVEDFYETHKNDYSKAPTQFLLELTKQCDHEIRDPAHGVNAQNSGCTAVLVYFYNNTLYCASVGDSRAIVGTSHPPAILPAPPAIIGEERKMFEEVKERRRSFASPLLQAVQLTRDQKPDDPEEWARISKCGGRVQQLVDEYGNKIGPYRIWEMNSNGPGLAMSRSLGDLRGQRVGVISTPVCTKYELFGELDYFIVAASDGIWDVLENDDVAHFVEFYREKCIKGVDTHTDQRLVSPENACIAQLLCEEARIRWHTIVEEEDVMIDDISCVIIELNQSKFNLDPKEHGKIPDTFTPVKNLENLGNNNTLKITSIPEIEVRDPRRGSFVAEKLDDI